MAGDWIKVEHVTPDKPEVHRMAELLGIDPDAVSGKLLRVWIWADQQTTDGHAPSVTTALLDRLTAVTGFAQAMAHPAVGWLVTDDTGAVTFPNFGRHNGASAKARAQGSKRQRQYRAVSRECNAGGVTEALPEKRREEKREEHPQPPECGEEWKPLQDPEQIAAYLRTLTSADPSPAYLSMWHAAIADLANRKADPETVMKALKTYAGSDPKTRAGFPKARFLDADWFLGIIAKTTQRHRTPGED